MIDLTKCQKCGGRLQFFTVKHYKQPQKVGWLGWVEDGDGELVGFVDLDDNFRSLKSFE